MKSLLLAVGAAASLAAPAGATVITRTYTVSEAPFTAAGPLNPGEGGSVTVSFDPAAAASGQVRAIVQTGEPGQAWVSASYDRDGDTLSILGDANGTALVIHDAASDKSVLAGELSAPAARAGTRLVKVTAARPARLPEPATWGMLVLGFGVIGWLARHRQRRAEAAFTERMRRIAAGEGVARRPPRQSRVVGPS